MHHPDYSSLIRGIEGNHIALALDFNRFDRDAEREANARLIAAAPDLLSELQKAAPWLAKLAADHYGDAIGARAQKVMDSNAAAIRKATGA